MTTNTLSLLAYKVAPNTFDISTGLVHISLRDQLIRGRTIVRDLAATGQLQGPYTDLLIVGAGAGGIAAAIEAAETGSNVLVVDTAGRPFGLQHLGSTRFVGPYMYEWPSEVHASQSFPPKVGSPLEAWLGTKKPYTGLTMPGGTPIAANKLALQWEDDLLSAMKHLKNLQVLVKVDPAQSKSEILRWINEAQRWYRRRPPELTIEGKDFRTGFKLNVQLRPRFTILAAGVGAEQTKLTTRTREVDGLPFWAPDSLSTPKCGASTEKARIVVVGGGDGALQDTFRCLTNCHTPRDAIDQLSPNARKEVELAFNRILTIEQQHSFVRIWTSGTKSSEFEALQTAYQHVIAILSKSPEVRDWICNLLREDIAGVYLIVRESALGKAYALNRFIILLIYALYEKKLIVGKKPEFDIYFDTTVDDIPVRLPGGYRVSLKITQGSHSSTETLDGIWEIVPRLGIQPNSIPAQQLGITKEDTQNRRELALIPQPFWPFAD